MYYALASIFFLTAGVQDTQSIRFPVPPTVAVGKLTSGMWFVVDSDVPVIVTASPLGLVDIVEESGPIKVRGAFAGGTGKTETRTFRGKQVFFIEAAKSGTCEILVIPGTAKSAADILRRQLAVDAGQGPPPPPKTAVAHLTFVGSTLATVPVVNDAALRARLKANGVKVWVSTAADFSVRSPNSAKIVVEVGVPCIILQDADGNVLSSVRMSSVAAANEFLNSYMGK